MVLALQSINAHYDPAIHTALAMAKKTLNRYYMLTDTSEMYRIAMGTYNDQFLMLYLICPILSTSSPSQTHLLCEG
jgi:hypothetical protein